MNRVKLLSAACISLALALTISCSSDDEETDGGGGLNLSDLPKDVYFVKWDEDDNYSKEEKYNGNGNITFELASFSVPDVAAYGCSGGDSYEEEECECFNSSGQMQECKVTYNTIQAGKIQNGQVLLDLPASIDSKSLFSMAHCIAPWQNSENCQSTLSVTPKNLSIVSNGSFEVAISGQNDCYMRLNQMKSNEGIGRTQFYYVSESGKVTGSEIWSDDENYEHTDYDMKFSKGWNLVYSNSSGDKNAYTATYSTDRPNGITLEWMLDCD